MAGVRNMTAGTLYVLEALLAADRFELSPTEVMTRARVLSHTAQRVLLRLVDDRHATRRVDGRFTRYRLTPDGVLWARQAVHIYSTMTSTQKHRYHRQRRRQAAVAGSGLADRI